MKRAANISWLTNREILWLSWWQELILNWIASWPSVGVILITSPDGTAQAEWSLPSDTELTKLQLEELLNR